MSAVADVHEVVSISKQSRPGALAWVFDELCLLRRRCIRCILATSRHFVNLFILMNDLAAAVHAGLLRGRHQLRNPDPL